MQQPDWYIVSKDEDENGVHYHVVATNNGQRKALSEFEIKAMVLAGQTFMTAKEVDGRIEPGREVHLVLRTKRSKVGEEDNLADVVQKHPDLAELLDQTLSSQRRREIVDSLLRVFDSQHPEGK